MKYKVTFYLTGKILDEIFMADSFQTAREVALAQYPRAIILGILEVME
jgi:hypothetical protein